MVRDFQIIGYSIVRHILMPRISVGCSMNSVSHAPEYNLAEIEDKNRRVRTLNQHYMVERTSAQPPRRSSYVINCISELGHIYTIHIQTHMGIH